MRVVFLGTGDIGVPSLKALARSGHEVRAVFTRPDRPAGRHLKLRPPPIKAAGLELGLPIFQPEKIRADKAVRELVSLEPEVIVVAAYGQILTKAILSLPRFGCINIHASLLPRHRGASPIHSTILAGDKESGVTIMQMDEGLDTGDILFQVAIAIEPAATAGSLHARLAHLAPDVLLECLNRLGLGTLQRQKQDDALATYAPKLTTKDGEVAWNKPAEEIDRQIRAMTPWPGAYTHLLLKNVSTLLKIHEAEIADSQGEPAGTVLATSERILVAAGSGGIALKEIQLAGGNRLSAAEFSRGHPIAPGTRLGKSE
jgi:methionyl-tRNA formyltransferase